LKAFGFDELTTYLVQAPPYAIAYITACLLAYSSGRFQESCYHIIIPITFSAAGCAILISTMNVAACYIGAILLVSGTYNGLNLQLFWETNTCAPEQKGGTNCYCKLCFSDKSLV
jgi:hypothetical protein